MLITIVGNKKIQVQDARIRYMQPQSAPKGQDFLIICRDIFPTNEDFLSYVKNVRKNNLCAGILAIGDFDETARIQALNAGVEFFIKDSPRAGQVIKACIKAVERSPMQKTRSSIIRSLPLSVNERCLVDLFIFNGGVKLNEISNALYGSDEDRHITRIRVTIFNLKLKLKGVARIESIRGFGYRLRKI